MSVGIIVLQQKRGRIANEDWITLLIRASYALLMASLTAKKTAYGVEPQICGIYCGQLTASGAYGWIVTFHHLKWMATRTI